HGETGVERSESLAIPANEARQPWRSSNRGRGLKQSVALALEPPAGRTSRLTSTRLARGYGVAPRGRIPFSRPFVWRSMLSLSILAGIAIHAWRAMNAERLDES